MHKIVIPLSSCGGLFRDDSELRFALRSIEKYFTDPVEVVIVGSRIPGWVQNVAHLLCSGGLKDALRLAATTYPDGFFWFYDDCVILRDTSAGDMRVTPRCRGAKRAADSKWGKQLKEIHERLESEGYDSIDFSRPHGPYWFDRSMVDEAFADWPDMRDKFPFESWILSKRKWQGAVGAVKQYYGDFDAPPNAEHRYLNYSDNGFTPKLRDWLSSRFPRASMYEPRGASFFLLNIAGTGGIRLLSAVGKHGTTNTQHKPLPWSDAVVQKHWKNTGQLPVVCIVADPVERAKAAYAEITASVYPESEPHYVVLRAMLRCMNFSEFWERVDATPLMTVIPHLAPQSKFLQGAPVDALLRAETLDTDLIEMVDRYELDNCDLTKAVVPSIDLDVTDAARNKILAAYSMDVNFLYPHLKHK